MNTYNKIRNFSFMLMGMLLLTLSACKKDKIPQRGENSIRCTIDGKPYTAEFIYLFDVNTGALRIFSSQDTVKLSLWIDEPTKPGTYALGNNPPGFLGENHAQYWLNSTDYLTSSSGSFVISEYVESIGKVKGTFSFEATDGTKTVNVSNGSFEIYK